MWAVPPPSSSLPLGEGENNPRPRWEREGRGWHRAWLSGRRPDAQLPIGQRGDQVPDLTLTNQACHSRAGGNPGVAHLPFTSRPIPLDPPLAKGDEKRTQRGSAPLHAPWPNPRRCGRGRTLCSPDSSPPPHDRRGTACRALVPPPSGGRNESRPYNLSPGEGRDRVRPCHLQ